MAEETTPTKNTSITDFDGSDGSKGQVLQTDGTNTSWADLESETVKTISSDYTTSGETALLIDKIEGSYNLQGTSSINTLSLSNYVTGIEWYSNGNKAILSDYDGLYQYSASTPYDSGTLTSDSISYNPSETSNRLRFAFANNGNKMYVLDGYFDDTVGTVYEYDLSTAYDLTTVTYTGRSKDVKPDIRSNGALGINFKDDGSIMLIATNGGGEGEVLHYDLSTNYDVSTASLSKSLLITADTNSTEQYLKSVWVNPDGRLMFISGSNNHVVEKFSLSTNWDVTTASLDVSESVDTYPNSVEIANDGKVLNVVYTTDQNIKYYSIGSSGVSTITLSSSDVSSGKIVRVKDTTGSAGSSAVTIDTEGSESIDGSSSISLNTNYGVKQLQSDGSNWFVISDG